MVLHKRSEYGFHGYQIPTMPRGCRSARKKRAVRYNVNPAELCAIDLLATVAGKLLQEKEAPSPRPRAAVAVKEEEGLVRADDRPVKVEPCDQGSCDEGAPVVRCQKLSHKHAFKETNSQASTSAAAGRADVRSKAAAPGPVFSRHSPAFAAVGGASSASPKVEKEEIRVSNYASNNSNSNIQALADQSNRVNKLAEDDPMDVVDANLPPPPPPLASSDSSVEVPPPYSPRGFLPRSSSIPRFHDNKSTMDHDSHEDADEDDGNSSACTHPSSASPKLGASFRPQRIGDRRIRKLLSSRFWKLGPAPLKDGEFYDRDMFRSKKFCYTRQKMQRSSFKRKKLLERSSVSSSSAGVAAETISKMSSDYHENNNHNNNHHKCIKGEPANGTSSSITSHRSSFKSEDYKVKLKIKSFKVPELFIEMPETATVGSLKRAVLETVTAMLGNGLKVGVIYQGRKVRDDSRTLLQAGIASGDTLDSLNFSLEPNASPRGASPSPLQIPHGSSSSPCSRAGPLSLEQCRSPRPLAARLPSLPEFRADAANSAGTLDAPREQGQTKVLGLANPPTGSDSSNKTAADGPAYADADADADHVATDGSVAVVPASSPSKALVPVNPPSPSSDLPLALVPASNKNSRRPETAQRRIRRPFSVAEVEALVQAVEKLGTGRWRDVKLQAFENAKHRTYVDLKDKWKTLVHTARISPQQRRGEPVPQELLDRVLVAHAHWSQHQARLQSSKHAANSASFQQPQQQQQPSGCLVLPLPPPLPEQPLQPLALPAPPAAAAAVN